MEQKTQLYDCHIKAAGRLVPFAGYLLPVQYETGVIAEHMAVRTAAGLFDVSHMGEVIITGKDALRNVQRLVSNECGHMYNGQVKYSPMCNESGGVVDDLLVYQKNTEEYLIVINAANRSKDVEWMQAHLIGAAVLADISEDISQLALQGPRAKEILCKLTGEETLPEKNYSFKEEVLVADIKCLVSRTGYTGEDGYELYCRNEDAVKLWQVLLEAGNYDTASNQKRADAVEDYVLLPCGLGARDTLRLEAGMPLYGHEMDDTISPLETGLGFAVKLEKEDFIGREGLLARGKPGRSRVGLNITGRGIAREACPVYHHDVPIGVTTSGTHCPYLGHPVAMALIEAAHSDIGTQVEIMVRGRKISAEVVALPFYKRTI